MLAHYSSPIFFKLMRTKSANYTVYFTCFFNICNVPSMYNF